MTVPNSSTTFLQSLVNDQRIGVSSWCWAADYYAGQFTLLDLPRLAAQKQIPYVEMNDFMLPVPRFSRVVQPLLSAVFPHLPTDLWRYRRSSLMRLKQLLDGSGVQCVCWTLNTAFGDAARTPLAQRLYWRAGIAAADILQVHLLRIILGEASDEYTPTDERLSADIIRFLRQAWSRLPQLQIVLENHWGLSTDIDRFVLIYQLVVKRLSASEQANFGLCFDPVNIPLESSDPNKQLLQRWRQMIPHALHAHLKATHTGRDIPLHELFNLFGLARYKGLFMVEDGDLLSRIPKTNFES